MDAINLSAGIDSGEELKCSNGWSIKRHHKEAAVPYTAFIIKTKGVNLNSEDSYNKIFNGIKDTFSFTKRNVSYVPETDSFSVIIPNHDKTRLEVYIKEIEQRYSK